MQNILACFGDSFTAGKVLDSKDKDFRMTQYNYPALLEKKFKDIKIINCGVNENTTIDALNRIKDDVLTKHPTHVLVLFGGNDARIDWFKLILSNFKSPKSKVSLLDYKKNLTKIAVILKKQNICPIFLTLPPLAINKFMNRLDLLFGIRFISIVKKHDGPRKVTNTYAKYNQAIKIVAKSNKIPIIDIRKEFLKSKDWRALLSEDGAHPSTKGQRFIADIIAKKLKFC